MRRVFSLVSALLVVSVLSGCGLSSGIEGEVAGRSVESVEPTSVPGVSVESSVEDGSVVWPDGVVGRGYEIPVQPEDAPPLPQWVLDFNPEMPELARVHSEEGAKAFAEYYFWVVSYELNTGTTTLLDSLSSKDCIPCQETINARKSLRKNGGWQRIDRDEIVRTSNVESDDVPGDYIFLTHSKQRNFVQKSRLNGSVKEVSDPEDYFFGIQLGWENHGWLVKSTAVGEQDEE